MYYLLIIAYTLLFFIISRRSIFHGLILFFAVLPSYLIRFSVGPIPTTLLEIMMVIIIFHALSVYNFSLKNILTALSFLKKNQYNTLLIGVGLFILGATINIFFANNFGEGVGTWKAFYIEPVLLFFALVLLSKKKVNIKKSILTGLLIGGVGTAVVAIFQHFTGWLVPHAFWHNRETYRVTAWWGFPNGVGIYLAPIAALAFGKGVLAKSRKYFGMGAIMTLGIVYAKGMGPLIAVLGATTLLLLYYKKTRFWTTLIAILVVISFLLLPSHHSIKKELLLQDYSGGLRVDIWAETTEFLQHHPVVGAGLRAYKQKIAPYRINKGIEVFHHPHNMFLAAWTEIGLVGLVGLLLILVWFVSFTIKYLSPKQYMVAAAILTFVIMGLVDSPYIKNDTSVMFWGLMAVVIRGRK